MTNKTEDITDSEPTEEYFLPKDYKWVKFKGGQPTVITEYADPLLFGLISRCCTNYATPEGNADNDMLKHEKNYWRSAQLETHCVEWLYVFKQARNTPDAYVIHSVWMADN